PVSTAGCGGSLRFRGQRRGGRDLPASRLPPARDRAGGCAGEGALVAGPARTARTTFAAARRRIAVGTRAATHAARDDRVEPRPVDAVGAGSVRSARGIRRRLHAGGRRGGL